MKDTAEDKHPRSIIRPLRCSFRVLRVVGNIPEAACFHRPLSLNRPLVSSSMEVQFKHWSGSRFDAAPKMASKVVAPKMTPKAAAPELTPDAAAPEVAPDVASPDVALATSLSFLFMLF